MKKILKQIFILSIISFIFLIPLTSAASGFKTETECQKAGTNGLCYEIDHGEEIASCFFDHQIKNNHPTNNYFIPVATTTEFDSFVAHPPEGVVISACPVAPAANCYGVAQHGCDLDRSKSCCAGYSCYLTADGGTADGICLPTKTITTNCTKCADENGRCSFSGTYLVYYGADTTFTSKSLTGGTDCNNAIFGDPLQGTRKACYICSSTTTTTDPNGHEQVTPITAPPAVPNPTVSSGCPYGYCGTKYAGGIGPEGTLGAVPQPTDTGGVIPGSTSGATTGSNPQILNPALAAPLGSSTANTALASPDLVIAAAVPTGSTQSGSITTVPTTGVPASTTTSTAPTISTVSCHTSCPSIIGTPTTPTMTPIPHITTGFTPPNSVSVAAATYTTNLQSLNVVEREPPAARTSPVESSGGTASRTCFVAGTQISMADGSVKEIQKISVGDQVVSYDEKADQFTTSTVGNLIIHDGKDAPLNDYTTYPLMKLSVKVGDKLISTEVTLNHPFYDPTNKVFKELKEFKLGDKLKTIEGIGIMTNEETLIDKNSDDLQRQTIVYNLEMANGPKNYLANGIVAHNKL
ncbi:Hom_end-associated Hint [uncultured archaeon]|nr:Hom_end-associated Hint [uncultured archaeon]